MSKNTLSVIAKIVSILYIVLITLFAFDERVFSLGFLIHLIPTIIFLACLVTAWFKPKLGGIFLVIVGIITIFFFKTYQDWVTLLSISIVPIAAGVLFFFSKKK